jgi:hypothetical protein
MDLLKQNGLEESRTPGPGAANNWLYFRSKANRLRRDLILVHPGMHAQSSSRFDGTANFRDATSRSVL